MPHPLLDPTASNDATIPISDVETENEFMVSTLAVSPDFATGTSR